MTHHHHDHLSAIADFDVGSDAAPGPDARALLSTVEQ
jgi:hypothetical protein